MKRYRVLIIVLVSLFLLPFSVNAETIADYRAKIKAIEAEKAESENKSAEVQKRIDNANAKINEITRQIVQAIKEQENTGLKRKGLNLLTRLKSLIKKSQNKMRDD